MNLPGQRKDALSLRSAPEGCLTPLAPPEPHGESRLRQAWKSSYTKAAGMALVLHIAVLGLAGFVASQMAVILPPPAPPPIEIDFVPSRLQDMGSGKLHLAPAPPAPVSKPKKKPKKRVARKPPPKPTPPERNPTPPCTTRPLPPSLPRETTPTSVALPLPGDKDREGSKSASGAGCAAGGARYGTGRGEGGGGYKGAGYCSGALPAYPSTARKAGREGMVTVRVLVGANGIPVSVTIRFTSGHDDFDNAAVQAVKKWRFYPARRGGMPVASFNDVRVRFRLDEAR